MTLNKKNLVSADGVFHWKPYLPFIGVGSFPDLPEFLVGLRLIAAEFIHYSLHVQLVSFLRFTWRGQQRSFCDVDLGLLACCYRRNKQVDIVTSLTCIHQKCNTGVIFVNSQAFEMAKVMSAWMISVGDVMSSA